VRRDEELIVGSLPVCFKTDTAEYRGSRPVDRWSRLHCGSRQPWLRHCFFSAFRDARTLGLVTESIQIVSPLPVCLRV